jgi:NTE family protein
MKKKTVSLVLGSGGAKGLAHIGIIKWLEDNNYKIESISGCSIGALIGGFHAAGKLDTYVDWLADVDVIDMLKLLDFKGSGGLVSGDTLMSKMKKLLGEPMIEDLPIKFTAVATDIDNEKEIWINKGSLLGAIRASISLPLFFTPYIYNSKVLVDGGVLNPVPIAPTFHDNTDLTIAVNLGAEYSLEAPLKDMKKESSFAMRVKEYLNGVSILKSMVTRHSMYSIANRSFETMQETIARMKLSAYPPDIEIKVPKNLCGTFDFHKSKSIIEYGYNLCEKTLGKKDV